MPKPVSDGEGEGASAKSAAPGPLTLMCRAVDTSFNSQPADVAQVWNLILALTLTLTLTTPTLLHRDPFKVWNLRGLANNAWHRVPVTLQPDASEDA